MIDFIMSCYNTKSNSSEFSNHSNSLSSYSIDKVVEVLNKEFEFDIEADSWMLMKTPWAVLGIIGVYSLFVLKIGPQLMEKRKPFNLKHIMMAYNILQLLFNGYMLSRYFQPGLISSLVKHGCSLDATDLNEKHNLRKITNEMIWLYLINKICDLMDTVFFVLRKKQSHVSFLHLYHHMNMVISSWVCMRFFKNHHVILVGSLNLIVHVVMYTYYFLAAMGPQIQKYLWWKVYLTRLQLVQFMIAILYFVSLFIFDCSFPKVFISYVILNITFFLYLFTMFYLKTYKKVKPE
ncbi:elongation of very long chain fatty acids protein AAEL008004-like isoform X2 [Daktulosphaira vitifoliae]|uniref:elongation of very long chain fatty acids protein AAEL008004-like isoform X2 n=1 Tax=Daktulosphaira vitifoliae TaxID=58002 RepID=UPI0021AABE28|nr:elongation of very long chain fatty acids protein AAEL008004-like isoform X2 [Daktulosphaira vitifoliae]